MSCAQLLPWPTFGIDFVRNALELRFTFPVTAMDGELELEVRHWMHLRF